MVGFKNFLFLGHGEQIVVLRLLALWSLFGVSWDLPLPSTTFLVLCSEVNGQGKGQIEASIGAR